MKTLILSIFLMLFHFSCKEKGKKNDENLLLLLAVTLPKCDYSITAENKTQTIVIPANSSTYSICGFDNAATAINLAQVGKYTMRLKAGSVLLTCRGGLSGSRTLPVGASITNAKTSANEVIFPSSTVYLNRTFDSTDKLVMNVSGINSAGFSCGASVSSSPASTLTAPPILTFSFPAESGIPIQEGYTLSGSCNRSSTNTCNDWFAISGSTLSSASFCGASSLGTFVSASCSQRSENSSKKIAGVCLYTDSSLGNRSNKFYYEPTFNFESAKTDCNSLKGAISEF